MQYHPDFALIFDMDGVIVDSNPAHKKALIQFCESHGFSLTEEELRAKIYGRTNRTWLTNLFGALSEEKLAEYTHEKESLYRRLFKPDIAPVPGLLTFLETARAANIQMLIGTSAPPENVHFTLSHTQTQDFFSHILDDTYVTHGKPHPEIYLKAVAQTPLPAERCIVLEDSLSGVEAGLQASCKVIGITTTHTPEELKDTHLVIGDFNELTLDHLHDLVNN